MHINRYYRDQPVLDNLTAKTAQHCQSKKFSHNERQSCQRNLDLDDGDRTKQQASQFLKKVNQIDGVREIRVIRSKIFAENPGFEVKDELEEQVIRTGKRYISFNDKNQTYREIIPFIAEKSCLDCHNVHEDDILGAARITIFQSKVASRIRANSFFFFIIGLVQIVTILVVLHLIIFKFVLRPLKKLPLLQNKLWLALITWQLKLVPVTNVVSWPSLSIP